MSEVISFQQITGASPTYHEVTAIRFCADDNYNPGLSTPCKVPPAGTPAYYSYWITLCMAYSGNFSLINNLRFWGPGNIAATWFPGSKGRMVAGRLDVSTTGHGFLVASYQRSSGTPGLTGYALKAVAPNGHAVYRDQTIAVVDVDTLTEAVPLVIDTTDITEAGYSKCWCVQTEAYPGAIHGEQSAITLVTGVDVV